MQRQRAPQPDASALAQEAMQRLIGQADIAFQAALWDEVTVAHHALLRLLHQRQVGITQSELVEMHARWGLAYAASRVPDQAMHHLVLAEKLLNDEEEQAARWANSQGIILAGEGDRMSLPLIHEALATLADLASRRSEPAARYLSQVISVADMMDEPQGRWQARRNLTAYLTAQGDWPALRAAATEWVALARERRDLPLLLEALRPLVEALVGQREGALAMEAQGMVVAVATLLGHESVAQEEQELEQMQLRA